MMHSAEILSVLLRDNFGIMPEEVVAIKAYHHRISFEKKINSEQEIEGETIIDREEINDFLAGKFVYYLSEHGMEMDYCGKDTEDFSKNKCNTRCFIIFTKDWIVCKKSRSNTKNQPMVYENYLMIIPRNY